MYVFQPASPRISWIWPFSGGITPFAFGNPLAHSVMHAMPLRVWLRPVSRHERGGEHGGGRGARRRRAPRGAAAPPVEIRGNFGPRARPAVALHRREPDVIE